MQIINSAINSSLNSPSKHLAVPNGKALPVSSADVGAGIAAVKNKVQPLVGTNDSANKAEQVLSATKQAQQNQDKQNSLQSTKQSFELDEATIAFFKNNQAQSQLVKDKSADSYSASAALDDNFSKDSISFQNRNAVSSYQSIGNLAQRESVQQIFGVDVFA